MKRSILIYLVGLGILCSSFAYAEEENLLLDNVNQYIENHIETYELSRDLRMQLHRNMMIEYEWIDCGAYPQEDYELRINELKVFLLKSEYFKKNPGSLENYSGDFMIPYYMTSNTTCDINGGFEVSTATIMNTYNFKYFEFNPGALTANPGANGTVNGVDNFSYYSGYLNGGSTMEVGADPLMPFDNYPITGLIATNNDNTPVSFMNGFGLGNNPLTNTSQIHFGSGAIRLNPLDDLIVPSGEEMNNSNGKLNVTVMERTFINDRDYFDYFFNLILHNPKTGSGHNHPQTEQAFFRVRLYDDNTNEFIKERVFISAEDDECNPHIAYKRIDNEEGKGIVYTNGWEYDFISIPEEYMNAVLKAEFVIGDCIGSRHAGVVYIDDICSIIPAEPMYGDISLNPIEVSCSADDFIEICGSYILPADSAPAQVEDFTLIITDENDSEYTEIINLSNNYGSLNQNGSEGTFCFNVPVNIFNGNGSSPYGKFYFQATAQFYRDGQECIEPSPLDPVNSNVVGAVDYMDCIFAEDDEWSIANCDGFSFSILENDLLFGQTPSYSDVNISFAFPIMSFPSGMSFDTGTGIVTVNPSVEPGTYTFNYKICNIYAPEDCSIATVTIHITSPTIEAFDDDFTDFPVYACEGGTTSKVQTNDFYCESQIGHYPLSSSWPVFNFEIVNNGGITNLTINTNGSLTIPPGTPPGNYTITYKICSDSQMENCDTAEVLLLIEKQTPTFNLPTLICSGSMTPTLPSSSIEGVNGTWSPAEVNNEEGGIYTFTPSNGECFDAVQIEINIDETCPLYMGWNGEVGCQEELDYRKFEAGIIENESCIKFCEGNIMEFYIYGSVSGVESIDWEITGGTIIDDNDLNIEVEWGNPGFGFVEAKLYLTNGEIKEFNFCVEIVNKPKAEFKIHDQQNPFIGCAETNIFFENLSSINNGHDELYYYWDFGDGHTSSEFEPSHIYDFPGVYEVSLQVTNGCSCTDEIVQRIHIQDPIAEIECIGVTCENSIVYYDLPWTLPQNPSDCQVNWKVEGGDIVYLSQDRLSIGVSWNDVDSEGFGYLTAYPDCLNCASTAKIPVVTARGIIQGNDVICTEEQATFSLPQWPTTEFDWSIETNTDASIILNIQRNEITVQAAEPGVIILKAEYYNTLLGCGGVAEKRIDILPEVKLKNPDILCKNEPEQFYFVDQNENPIINSVNYEIKGPDNYSFSGSGTSFNQSFPASGLYKVFIYTDNYCVKEVNTFLVSEADENPTDIEGETIICPGISYQYSTDVPAGFSAYWTVTGGTILGASIGDQIQVDFNPNSQEDYEVSVYFDNEDCQSDAFTLSVEIDALDLEIISDDNEVCGSSFSSYQANDDSAEIFEWSISPENAGSIAFGQNTQNIEVLWNAEPQTAMVKLKGRKCGVDYETQFEVNIISPPEAVLTSQPEEACVGHEVNFSLSFVDDDPDYAGVIWNFGDGSTTVGGLNQTHTYQMPLYQNTTYTVTAEIQNPNGCQESVFVTHDIVVSPSPVVEISPRYFNLCGEGPHLIGLNIQTGFGSTTAIQWYKGDNLVLSNENDQTLDVGSYGAGFYYATVENNYGCIDTTPVATVLACPEYEEGEPGQVPPCPTLSFTATAEITDCQEVTLEINPSANNPAGTSYQFMDLAQLGGTITQNGNTYTVSGLEPGYYNLSARAIYYTENGSCSKFFPLSFIVPYKAGLKYEVTACHANEGYYEVNILDHSVYYPTSDITGYAYEFKVDNGSWQNGTVQNGIHQLQAQLTPGSHTLSVRIQDDNAAFEACETSTVLTLPDFPTAGFSFINHGCANEAIQFFPNDINSDWIYEWSFGDESTNTQQNPYKTFPTGNPFVTLNVTNQFGCSFSHTENLTVSETTLTGTIEADKTMACEGDTILLYFEPAFGENPPQTIEWYRNTDGNHKEYLGTSDTYEATESGQYYVFITDENGCHVYDTDPISISFVPLPKAPRIKGEDLFCLGETVELSVPEVPGIKYNWVRLGEGSAPINVAINQSEITDTPSAQGTYQYMVLPTYEDGSSVSCIGEYGVHQITVWKQPEIPEIDVQMADCDPYQVHLSVSNPEPGVTYTWSNGDVGQTTVMSHDGPIQVTAHIGKCETSNQVDLPLNLEVLGWIFPQGCYDTCYKDYLGYVIGPLGEFKSWSWFRNNQVYQTGTGMVNDLNVSIGNHYGLQLTTQDCEVRWENLDISGERCVECDIKIDVKDIFCRPDGSYDVVLLIDNNMPAILGANILVPLGEGFFVNSGLSLNPGVNLETLHFIPSNTFNLNQNIEIFIDGIIEGKLCEKNIYLSFPPCTANHNLEIEEEIIVFKLYPNPTFEAQTRASYQVSLKKGENQLVVRDLYGRSLIEQKLTSAQGEILIDCSSLAKGVYMVSLQNEKQILKTIKLIVK